MSRGILVFLFIMALETVHGILRGLFLVPQIGETMSGRIGWPVGVLIVLGLSTILIDWTGLSGRSDLLRLGVIWAGLTAAFEIAIGLLRGLDASRVWSEINPLDGGLMLYSLAVMLFAPVIGSRLRRFFTNPKGS
jgi:hypothetical protein